MDPASLSAFWAGGPGWTEILIILVVALVLFGNRLPQVARSLGKGLLEFKRGLRGFNEELQDAASEDGTVSDAETVDTKAKPAEEEKPAGDEYAKKVPKEE